MVAVTFQTTKLKAITLAHLFLVFLFVFVFLFFLPQILEPEGERQHPDDQSIKAASQPWGWCIHL